MDGPNKSILRVNEKIEEPSFQSIPDMFRGSATQSPSGTTRMKNLHGQKRVFDCDCAPDIYNRVLGPTVDEIFLKGLNTVFNLCSKFMSCEKESEVHFEPEPVKSAPKVVSEILESIGIPPELASQIVQTSFAELEEEKPLLASKILQTSTPEMVSRILSTLGLQPELVSQIIQTMSFESVKPSIRSGMMQTSGMSMNSVFAQTSEIDPSKSDLSKSTIKMDPSMVSTKTEAKSEGPQDVPEQKDSPPLPPRRPLKMCVCCQCSPADLPSVHEANEELSQEVEESEEKPKMCACCKCQEPKCNSTPKPRYCSIFDSIRATFDPPKKVRICRCYDCAAPVVYRISQKRQEYYCGKPKETKCRCSAREHHRNSRSNLSFAKGDTCSLVDTTCCENVRNYRYG